MIPADAEMRENEFRLIRDLINDQCGIWFPDHRRESLAMKLERRRKATCMERFRDYYMLLKYGEGDELEKAIDAIVNNETYFFREMPQLEAIVELVKSSAPKTGRAFRILSAGCSTGEEPYTLAMLLDEAKLLDTTHKVDIHGIDISTHALDRARTALYSSGSFRCSDGRYLDWYFDPMEGRLQLSEALRRAVSFTRHNLHDHDSMSSLGPFDVILCRNVIIYFDAPNKLNAVNGLMSLMREGGHLFMGHSESLYKTTNALEMVQVQGAIGYRRPLSPTSSDGPGRL